MLRFILVTAAHSLIKYSKEMKMKYLSIVRRLGKNRAIVAIARILLESIFIMLSRKKEFDNDIESLTEHKRRSMSLRAKNPTKHRELEETLKIYMEKRDKRKTDQPFS